MRARATIAVAVMVSVAVLAGIVVCDANGLGERCGADCGAQSLRSPHAATASGGAGKALRMLAVIAAARSLEPPPPQSIASARSLVASSIVPPSTSNPILRV